MRVTPMVEALMHAFGGRTIPRIEGAYWVCNYWVLHMHQRLGPNQRLRIHEPQEKKEPPNEP